MDAYHKQVHHCTHRDTNLCNHHCIHHGMSLVMSPVATDDTSSKNTQSFHEGRKRGLPVRGCEYQCPEGRGSL
jgi:hypothetical protein